MDNKPVFAIACPDFLTTGNCNLRCKYCFEPDKIPVDMDSDLIDEYMSHNPCTAAMIFGGEPLLVFDKICQILDSIELNPDINQKRKKSTLNKARNIITNGLLIHKYVERIKKYNLSMQISVDGCKEAHDSNRVDVNGKGSWDDSIAAIKCCIDNDIDWSVHGVVNKDTLPYLFESFKWFFNIYAEHKSLEYALDHLKHNTFQIVFEEDYDDDDIDIIIEQFRLIGDWIYEHEELTKEQKIQLFDNWFFKTGGTCGAGTGLMALDDKLNIYPCHRNVFGANKDITMLGNVFEPENFDKSKYNLFNALYNLSRKRKYMYSVATNINNWNEKEMNAWFMWCPTTNLQESGNPYFQPAKYNLMFTELNRFIRTLRTAYFGSR
jgi:sulfatase maturation enzyme AslB (radical SAM superfamily)